MSAEKRLDSVLPLKGVARFPHNVFNRYQLYSLLTLWLYLLVPKALAVGRTYYDNRADSLGLGGLL